MTDAWQELSRIPGAMADAVRPHLATVTRQGYERFLAAMVHYTRGSGERLHHAAKLTPEGELHRLFAELARDEAGHYRLAEADLAAFGKEPGDVTPAPVVAFHRAWLDEGDPASWLGALYVLESVGAHLVKDATQNLGRLGLGPDQVRFVMVHLEADIEHSSSVASHAQSYAAKDGARVLAAARAAAEFWVGLHLAAWTGDDGIDLP
jgi:hypothetical protein